FRDGRPANNSRQRSKSSPAPTSPARISKSGGWSCKSESIRRVAASPGSRIPQCKSAVTAIFMSLQNKTKRTTNRTIPTNQDYASDSWIRAIRGPFFLCSLPVDHHAELESQNQFGTFTDRNDTDDFAWRRLRRHVHGEGQRHHLTSPGKL